MNTTTIQAVFVLIAAFVCISGVAHARTAVGHIVHPTATVTHVRRHRHVTIEYTCDRNAYRSVTCSTVGQ